MNPRLENVLATLNCSPELLQEALAASQARKRRYQRLWSYYANPARPVPASQDADRPYRQAQEWGLPARITGSFAGPDPLSEALPADRARKEVVIENDIAWRIDTMVEYLFGQRPQLHAPAPSDRARQIISLLNAILDNAGGVPFLQQLALIGAINGSVDIAVTLDTQRLQSLTNQNNPRASGPTSPANTANPPESELAPDAPFAATAQAQPRPSILEIAALVSLRVVEPARTFVLLDPADISRLRAFGQDYTLPALTTPGPLNASLRRLFGQPTDSSSHIMELWTADAWYRWRDDRLEASGGNSLGQIPLVHIQNAAVPFAYDGASDVQPLLPLQDELNTRLSDRAHRIAMQSFRMYLGVGTTTLLDQPPMPGRVWQEAPGAEIHELGGDASSPAEETHIAEIREALDRASGVPPVAAGAIRNRIGNLTSAAALRITLISLLARTERKRALYGAGLIRAFQLALAWLDAAGIFPTTIQERQLTLHWPDPLPENQAERLAEAKLKLDIGVGKEVILQELGYD